MRILLIVACLVMLAALGFYDPKSGADYRQSTVKSLASISQNITQAHIDLDNIQSTNDDGQRNVDFSQQVKEARARISEHHKAFLSFERKIKEENSGEVPQWLKEDRAWQTIDKLNP
jgi:hypothetical protein